MAQGATGAEDWVELTCAFCQGKGRDPFGLLSVLSTCGACRGAGKVRVKGPYVPCRACGGTGVQPFARLACLGCGGRGVQTIEEPVKTCPVCGGTGVDGLHLHCLRCHGAGVVPAAEETTLA